MKKEIRFEGVQKLQHSCIRWAPNAQDWTYKTNTVGEKTAMSRRTKVKIENCEF